MSLREVKVQAIGWKRGRALSRKNDCRGEQGEVSRMVIVSKSRRKTCGHEQSKHLSESWIIERKNIKVLCAVGTCIKMCMSLLEVSSFQRVLHVYVQSLMELGPEYVSLLERCPYFRGCYIYSL